MEETVDKTALLVIDVQPGNVGKCYRADEVVERIAGLVAQAREKGVPVVYIQDDDVGTVGDADWAIDPRVAPQVGEAVVRKKATDAFYGTNLHEVLQGLCVTRLVVTGARTEFCVDSACRRATTLGYNVLLVSDAHTTADSAVLPAGQVIAHANRVFSMLENLENYAEVAPAAEVDF